MKKIILITIFSVSNMGFGIVLDPLGGVKPKVGLPQNPLHLVPCRDKGGSSNSEVNTSSENSIYNDFIIAPKTKLGSEIERLFDQTVSLNSNEAIEIIIKYSNVLSYIQPYSFDEIFQATLISVNQSNDLNKSLVAPILTTIDRSFVLGFGEPTMAAFAPIIARLNPAIGSVLSREGFDTSFSNFPELLGRESGNLANLGSHLSTVKKIGKHLTPGDEFFTISDFDASFQNVLGLTFSEGSFSGRASLFSFDSRFGFGVGTTKLRMQVPTDIMGLPADINSLPGGPNDRSHPLKMTNIQKAQKGRELVSSASGNRMYNMIFEGTMSGLAGATFGGAGGRHRAAIGGVIGGLGGAYKAYANHPLTHHENKFDNKAENENKRHQQNVHKIETDHAKAYETAEHSHSSNIDSIEKKSSHDSRVNDNFEKSENTVTYQPEGMDQQSHESKSEQAAKKQKQQEIQASEDKRDKEKKAADDKRQKELGEENRRHKEEQEKNERQRKKEKDELEEKFGKPCYICDENKDTFLEICDGLYCFQRPMNQPDRRTLSKDNLTRPSSDGAEQHIIKVHYLHPDNYTRWLAPKKGVKLCDYGNPIAKPGK